MISENDFLIDRLASGATWQSSGQGVHIQNALIQTHFAQYSRQLYEKLQNDGHDIGNNLVKNFV
jgi:hypothetical protein